MAVPVPRFKVLDAWRGLAASLVALFHLQAYSHLYELSFLRHSFLFVDFFFVLSGFVMTANYRARLLSGFSFWHFMLLRMGRLYPLHIAILAVFVGLELTRYKFSGSFGGELGSKFSGPNSVDAIFTNILLIQGLGVHDRLTWNMPSWSISTEFYTYAIFAVVLLLARTRAYLFAAFVIVAAPVFLLKYVGHIDAQYDFGIVRCVLGFFVGFVCYDLYQAITRNMRLHADSFRTIMFWAESFGVGLVILFVCYGSEGAVSLAAPEVFGLVVLIFAFEEGAVSQVLKKRLFVFVGTLSYSIYMVHMLVEIGVRYFLQLAEKKLGIMLFNGARIGAKMWQGDISYVITLCLVVATSYLTYSFIEEPGRRRSRKIADRLFAGLEGSNPDGKSQAASA